MKSVLLICSCMKGWWFLMILNFLKSKLSTMEVENKNWSFDSFRLGLLKFDSSFLGVSSHSPPLSKPFLMLLGSKISASTWRSLTIIHQVSPCYILHGGNENCGVVIIEKVVFTSLVVIIKTLISKNACIYMQKKDNTFNSYVFYLQYNF
jgi:hypothetical protein